MYRALKLFTTEFLDLLAPRACRVCGNRLTGTEETVCTSCYLHLPRTGFSLQPYDNIMARLLWGHINVERVAALYYHESQAETANIIYSLKYKGHKETGMLMGRMMASELQPSGFFEGIDAIVPVPLARKRQRQRGYNQSYEIARGISRITGLPIYNKVVRRTTFHKSQTTMGRHDRQRNVEGVFELTDAEAVSGCHLLVVDDVMTTGATIAACAKALTKADGVRISVLTLAFTKS